MISRFFTLPYLLLILLTFASPLKAHEVFNLTYDKKKKTSLKLETMGRLAPSSGFLSVRATAFNGEKAPVTWSFNVSSEETEYYSGDEMLSSFSLTCAPGKTQASEFLIPLVTARSDYEAPSVTCKIKAPTPYNSFNVCSIDSLASDNRSQILISEALSIPNLSYLDAAISKRRSSYSNDFGSSFIPRLLSNNWLSYSGFDAMAITASEWSNLSSSTKNAILQWNRLGGRIHIFDDTQTATFASLGLPNENNNTNTLERSWGLCEIYSIPTSLVMPDHNKIVKDLIGRFNNEANRNYRYADEAGRRTWPLQKEFGKKSENPILFVLILLIFAIVVGPLNLFVFTKPGQRHRLFITTPIISIGTSILLVALIFLVDGAGGKGSRIAFIEVRPDENTHYIQQNQISTSGVLFKTNFTTPTDTYITPKSLKQSRLTQVYEDGPELRFRTKLSDNGTYQHSGDFFKSRSLYAHSLLAIQSSRQRLELSGTETEPVVTSTFSYPINTIYYRDPQDKIWTNAKPLTQGRPVSLREANDANFQKWHGNQRSQLSLSEKASFTKLAFRPGHFIARAEEAELIDTLKSIKWQKSTAILSGPLVRK